MICCLRGSSLALHQVILCFAERRQFFHANLLPKTRTIFALLFRRSEHLSEALLHKCNCRFVTTASILKLLQELSKLLKPL